MQPVLRCSAHGANSESGESALCLAEAQTLAWAQPRPWVLLPTDVFG